MHESKDRGSAALEYQLGFGNEFATEALAGALPSQNSPQRLPHGLVSELVSGTTFSAPRAQNRRSYLFRIRPSTVHTPFEPIDTGTLLTPPFPLPPYPGALRWGPAPLAAASGDFLQGLFTICGAGSPRTQHGVAIHGYRATRSMTDRAFADADGELLIIAEHGALKLVTELGKLSIEPGELALIPKGMTFRVELAAGPARGFVIENFGLPFVLPELGLIGSHGLANAVDFRAPVAAFEDSDAPVELIHKLAGNLWRTTLDHSPFDVVAWRGNWAPLKYDMRRFAVMGTVGTDHPDPSIYCALSSPSSSVAGGNVDFMILPPRWMVAEHTFRPPGYHRNSVSEVLAVVAGSHEARAAGFPPGSMSLHNNWTAHGPDVATFEAARSAPLAPQKIEDALLFMVESRFAQETTAQAMSAEFRLQEPERAWADFRKRFPAR